MHVASRLIRLIGLYYTCTWQLHTCCAALLSDVTGYLPLCASPPQHIYYIASVQAEGLLNHLRVTFHWHCLSLKWLHSSGPSLNRACNALRARYTKSLQQTNTACYTQILMQHMSDSVNPLLSKLYLQADWWKARKRTSTTWRKPRKRTCTT